MPPIKKDHYKILGIPPLCTPEDIRKAYRNLSKKYHPDLNPDLKLYSDEKMKELVAAYNVLNDHDKRKEYDNLAHFQIRKSVKANNRKRAGGKKQLEKAPSLLDKISSMFTKKKKDDKTHPDPKQADIHFTLGITMAENDSFIDQAEEEFKQTIKFDPGSREAHYNLGVVCYKLGKFDEALVYFQKVLTLDKDDSHARTMVALLREEAY